MKPNWISTKRDNPLGSSSEEECWQPSPYTVGYYHWHRCVRVQPLANSRAMSLWSYSLHRINSEPKLSPICKGVSRFVLSRAFCLGHEYLCIWPNVLTVTNAFEGDILGLID